MAIALSKLIPLCQLRSRGKGCVTLLITSLSGEPFLHYLNYISLNCRRGEGYPSRSGSTFHTFGPFDLFAVFMNVCTSVSKEYRDHFCVYRGVSLSILQDIFTLGDISHLFMSENRLTSLIDWERTRCTLDTGISPMLYIDGNVAQNSLI